MTTRATVRTSYAVLSIAALASIGIAVLAAPEGELLPPQAVVSECRLGVDAEGADVRVLEGVAFRLVATDIERWMSRAMLAEEELKRVRHRADTLIKRVHGRVEQLKQELAQCRADG